MSTLRHITYNLLDYGRPDDPIQAERMAWVRQTLASCAGDVFSVQEIFAENPDERVAVFTELAADMGLDCWAVDRRGERVPVFDPGPGRRGVGVMWRPDRITAVPGTVRTYGKAGLGGGMALVHVRVEDRVELTVASAHPRPRFPRQRADGNVFIAAEIIGQGPHGIAAADWNENFASRNMVGDYYDPDPYEHRFWQPRFIGKGRPNPETGMGIARREAMQELLDGGLVDPAAFIGADWYRTVGHWSPDAIDKRIDGPMVTKMVAAATRSISSLDEVPAHTASDHLPVMLEVDLALLAAA